ncbi:MAG: bifunctional 5,10-methylenetetrahydrofolate dehydrogenase/5,10-methenyltetrahydrofolate cyclohydrolase [Candidatus Latescibacteria bacterium]|nr:bifunctional 5,10-methylenetetrahydrofolate dehydrogenase/5,10-methenyltetrahydrofolate cyclohydrolase [Candidatus Latescibacterota bacterium]
MGATLIDGKAISLEMRQEMTLQVAKMQVTPHLAAVLVGDDPASAVYVRNKEKSFAAAGMRSTVHRLPGETTHDQLVELVQQLNTDDDVDGILVQSPVPKHITERAILEVVDPIKDVDCFHPENVGRLVAGEPRFAPCTPTGVQQLLIRSGVETDGAEAVVVGRSDIVGKPMVNLLIQKAAGANATITICHTGTRDLAFHTSRADILIVAAGRAEVITGDMIKPGATVIDVGMNRVDNPARKFGHRLVGDVHFESAVEVAGKITPVPGGVGPMTITMLLANTLKAARLRRSDGSEGR